jgi:hypothetical protein
MAGDDQMDPADLDGLVAKVVSGDADYVKGNRLIHPEAKHMPLARRLGTQALAKLTCRASVGIGANPLHVGDTQCGFTALSKSAAAALPLGDLWPRYGYPGDLLLLLVAAGFRIAEVPVRPVYADEKSGLRPWHLLQIAGIVQRRAHRLKRASRQTLARAQAPVAESRSPI